MFPNIYCLILLVLGKGKVIIRGGKTKRMGVIEILAKGYVLHYYKRRFLIKIHFLSVDLPLHRSHILNFA